LEQAHLHVNFCSLIGGCLIAWNFSFTVAGPHFEKRKNLSLFISLCILRDLPQQKIPRELCRSTIFLCSHVPLERFFDGTDQENSKTQGGKGQIRLIPKNQEGKNGEKKKKILFCKRMWKFPYSCVFHLLGTPSCDPP
jgi:hypothetical protein